MSMQLTVEGMSCEHCEQTVVEALESVEGVTHARADRETDSATVEGDAEPTALIEAVTDAGYSASA
ncbi:MAG: cation transporter [Halobacteriales archaeon]|nr:cation transporter [Halobacteriales archaeon]